MSYMEFTDAVCALWQFGPIFAVEPEPRMK
jgi:hypothetical protein